MLHRRNRTPNLRRGWELVMTVLRLACYVGETGGAFFCANVTGR
jgi:hypothetical protein